MNQVKRALTLVAFVPYPWHHAVTMLRVLRPYEQANVTVLRGCENGQVYLERIGEADAILIQREYPAYGFDGDRSTAAYDQIVQLARQAKKPLIYEIDDLLLELPEEHPDHAVQYYTAALFPMLRAILESDLVTTTTPTLQRYYQALNSNTCLLPNYLDNQLWEPTPRTILETRLEQDKATHKPVIIGYMGSSTHVPDLEQIAPALAQILDRFGEQVQMKFWGARPPSLLGNFPNVEWYELELFNYPEFVRYFSSQVSDIFIAPLLDSFFNQCKSAIKYFEYSIQGVPGIYSKVAPYEQVIHHGQDGLLAASLEDWVNHLSYLVQNPTLRLEMGLSAQENVLRNWLLSEHASQWATALERALTAGQSQHPVDPEEIHGLLLRLLRRASGWQMDLQHQVQNQAQEIEQLHRMLEEMGSPVTVDPGQNGAKPEELRLQLTNIQRQMDEILTSESWKIGQFFARTKQKLFPEGSWQSRIGQKISWLIFRGQTPSKKPGPNTTIDKDRTNEP